MIRLKVKMNDRLDVDLKINSLKDFRNACEEIEWKYWGKD